MANVLFAARKAATSSLTTVSASADAVATVASSLSNYASMLELHSQDAIETYATTLASDRTERIQRRVSMRAMEDALYHIDLDDQLSKNPKLAALYEKAMQGYLTANSDALTKLNK